jgi:hypothetical protein
MSLVRVAGNLRLMVGLLLDGVAENGTLALSTGTAKS